MQVNILDAKNRLSQLIKSVQAGDEVVIANRGLPVARLVPARAPAPPASSGTFLQWLQDNPLPSHAQRSAEEIDAAIGAERNAWD
ncbi:MAG TPA: type II toxin-antitoxin system prevent-host-death family antitoxin [Ideonella sp.]|nr:type II toxin-antitoxin system prevent-host-death family antitoxin [Ideonella sp.]